MLNELCFTYFTFTVVPLSIGGIGLVELGLTGMILLYGISFEKALAFALLTRLIKIIVNVTAGTKTLFLRENKDLQLAGK